MHNTVEICTQCHKAFLLTTEQKIWYFQRGLCLPKRCPVCRKQRRENRDPYEGWKSTMRTENVRKKTHSMVPYAPFVIGGITR